MALRLAFMGTPDFAAGCLSEIVASGHEVVCVYTQPPRRSGRGQMVRPTPVQVCAERLGLSVHAPLTLRSAEEVQRFQALDADAAVVVAYGQILREPILAAPRLGCFNVHASLLPRWRGAAPIQRAIMAGDHVTGVQIMRMEEGLDTGPILLSETTPIGEDDTAGSLHDRLAHMGAQLLPRALAALERGVVVETPQGDSGATYAEKIDKAEARILWTEPAVTVDRHIRGLSPFPGAWFEVEPGGNKRALRVKALFSRAVTAGTDHDEFTAGAVLPAEDGALRVACANGAVELVRVQREGKKPQTGAEFLRGLGAHEGMVFR